MQSLDELLAVQGDLEHTYADFLSSLDQERTVTLRQLLTEPDAIARLQAPWINREIVLERFEALGRFLTKIGDNPRFITRCRLIFFQPNDEEADQAAHTRLKREELYAERFGHLPIGFTRFHTSTKWMDLFGTWEEGARRLWPLSNYTTWYSSDMLRHGPATMEEEERAAKAAWGYAVPTMPSLLGVGHDTATDYFIRPVIHDIGHNRLPKLDSTIDSLHNAVMLSAVGPLPVVHENVWERMVHCECTDPHFYVYGERMLKACSSLELTPLQAYYLKTLRRWYASPAHHRNKGVLWDIEPGWNEIKAQARMNEVIEEMCRDGFLRYDLKKNN